MSTRNVDSTEGKKRPALEEAGGIQKKPMTNPNPNPQGMVSLFRISSLRTKATTNPLLL
jgi:hypothetical protein